MTTSSLPPITMRVRKTSVPSDNDISRIIDDLRAKLKNPRGSLWYRKLRRMLSGELCGNKQTSLKLKKEQIRIEGGPPVMLINLLNCPEGLFSGSHLRMTSAAMRAPCMSFFEAETPALDISISEITQQADIEVSSRTIFYWLGEDAYLPIQTMVNFMKSHMMSGFNYIFPIEDHEGNPAALLARFIHLKSEAGSEANKEAFWELGYCGADTQHPPRNSIVVHLDHFSMYNEDVLTAEQ